MTVEQQRIPSSAGLLRALRDGDLDVALTSSDNVVRDAVITPAQLAVVLELRKRWAGFSEDVDIAAEIRRPRGLIDERFACPG